MASISIGGSGGGGGGGGGGKGGSYFGNMDPSRALEMTQIDEAKKAADEYAKTQQALSGQLADIDVWAAEQNVKAGEAAADRSYSALANLGSSRAVGGGSYNTLMSGRGSINLGGMSGGLAAANTAKLKEEMTDAANTKATAANTAIAARSASTAQQAQSLHDMYTRGSEDAVANSLKAMGYTDAQIAAGEQGWATQYGGYRMRVNSYGQTEWSDANGNFSGNYV